VGGDADAHTGSFTCPAVPAFVVAFWAPFGSCCVIVEFVVICNGVLRFASGIMTLELTVSGGTIGLAGDESRAGAEDVGGHAGILYNEGRRRTSEALDARMLGWAAAGAAGFGVVLSGVAAAFTSEWGSAAVGDGVGGCGVWLRDTDIDCCSGELGELCCIEYLAGEAIGCWTGL
jgi:hypothetical protein